MRGGLFVFLLIIGFILLIKLFFFALSEYDCTTVESVVESVVDF
jgi:hypothetical protein